MRKTKHQLFIDTLHKQLSADSVCQMNSSNTTEDINEDNCEEDELMRQLEQKFSELFGDLNGQ